MDRKWKSNAEWPEGHLEGDPCTHDYHWTRGEADAVCSLLEKEGFGGEGRVFPVKTWTSENND